MDAVSQRELSRARSEVRLLSAICPLGLRGLVMAYESGIGLEQFSAPDTLAIFAAIVVAERFQKIGNREATYLLAIESLRISGLWDASDLRPFASGMRWGPAGLAALFCRLAPQTAESLLPTLAERLLSIPPEN